MNSDESPPRRSHRPREDDDADNRYARERTSRREAHGRLEQRERKRPASRNREPSGGEGRTQRRRSRSPYSRDSRSQERRRYRDRDHHRRRSPEDDRRDHKEREGRRERDHDRAYGEDDRRDRQMVKRRVPLPSQADSFAVEKGEEPPKEKEKPNYGTTGALAAASNSVQQSDGSAIVLKYHEPPEARKPSPKDQWRLFIFKGKDVVDTVELNHRSCWLVGRERAVVDLAAEHPSISKQHAVIQFRYQEKRNEYGDKIGKVKPYLIDLESANGTMLNSKKVPESRYLELRDKDLIQFGQSTREYVLMLAPKD